MVKCCITGCRSSSKLTLTSGVRLHRFPTKNQALRRKWIKFALLSGTKLDRLDVSDRNNTRICSQHFINRNRDEFPEPSVLPNGRSFEVLDANSEEAKYIIELDMQDTLQESELSGTYQFHTEANSSLEDFIDSRLAELDFGSMIDRAAEQLENKLRQHERKTREINQIFTHCEEKLKIFRDTLEFEQGIERASAVRRSGSDSEDDVQFVHSAYDPQLASRHRQISSQHRTGGLQQNFVIKGGSLTRQGQQQQAGGRGPPTVEPGDGAPTPGLPLRPLTTMYAPPSKHADLVVGMKLYGKKVNDYWYKGTLNEIHNKEKPRAEWRYRVKFDYKGMKVLPGKEVAFADCPKDTLPVGSRVVGRRRVREDLYMAIESSQMVIESHALYKEDDSSSTTSYYAGIVAESPSVRNSQRYLIFFDDGYAQYCYSNEIHKVYEQSRNVWEDIQPDSQEFIKGYLKQYPERPMVRLQSGQVIKTEWNGSWWTARVLVTDASLVKMYFDADKRVEWIYRGSTRLEPLFTELANAENSKSSGKGHRRHNLGMKNNRKPIVEYLRGTEEDYMRRKQPVVPPPSKNKPQQGLSRNSSTDSLSGQKKRPVARKSTGKYHSSAGDIIERRQHFQASSIGRHSQGRDMASVLQDRLSTEYDMGGGEALGERMEIDRCLPVLLRKKFEPHQCSPSCLDGTEIDPTKFRGNNPLIIPMLCGWERQISRQKNPAKRAVFYRAPCARRLRSLWEVEKYLHMTDSELTIDWFCYNPNLHTHSEFVPIKTFCDIKDLSYGKETVPISCVNGIDRQYPDYVEYSNQRTPAKGVTLNLDTEFLVGCDCTDYCDPETCSCVQFTVEASKAMVGPKPEVLGYQHRRLKEPILTGIYECNQRCKCDHRCGNRVAQNGLQLRLQVFKTEKRGWGLRSLDDIPAGGFICVYAGQLLTEQGANEDGQQYGDEYLAELDYIEVVEKIKEGYESEYGDLIKNLSGGEEEEEEGEEEEEEEEEEEDYNAPSDSDSTFSGDKYVTDVNPTGTPNRKSSRRKAKKASSDVNHGDEPHSTKIVIRRDTDQNTSWSVKVKSPQSKTKEWVDKLPDPPVPMTIVISDEDDGTNIESKEGGKSGKEEKGKNKKTVEESADVDSKKEKEEEGKRVKQGVGAEGEQERESVEDGKINRRGKGTGKEEPNKGETKGLVSDNGAGEKDQKEKTGKEELEEGEIVDEENDEDDNVEQKTAQQENKKDSDLDSLGEQKLEKPVLKSSHKVSIRLRPRVSTSGEAKTSQGESESTKERNKSKSQTLIANDDAQKKDGSNNGEDTHKGSKRESKRNSTSKGDKKSKPVPIDEGNSDSNDAQEKTKGAPKTLQSRFRNLPDPKSQQVISPIKVKQSKETAPAEKVTEPAEGKKNNKKKDNKAKKEEEEHIFDTRLFFNEEFCYVMDAKSMGNIGRYLNHSCAPNVFVQNVFVDTHDLRFPWVAFFAGQYIRAGTELTWDYNYEVGSVPGKVLYCYCGAAECRGRLL